MSSSISPGLGSMPQPSAVERVRSACVRANHAMLAVEPYDPIPTTVHLLRACGDVVMAVPMHEPLPANTTAMLEVTDRAPVPLREPVRSLVWLSGTLQTVPAVAQRRLADQVAIEHPHLALLDVGFTTVLVRLVLDSVVVADTNGAEPVDVDALRRGEPDPFWEMEAAWLQHLDLDHPEAVASLARKIPAAVRHGRPRPLALDRYGITLRMERHDGDADVRLPFEHPADDVESLSRAVRTLVES